MKTLIYILLLTFSFGLQAQSKQDKVMLQQIAALKTYGTYLKKGYNIASDGLRFIGNMKGGELGLHSAYYEGLKLVNPAIRNYPKVESIVDLYGRLITISNRINGVLVDDLFHGDEKAYIRRVLEHVAQQSADDLEALEDLLTDNQLEADDAERMARIDALEKEMKDRYTFLRGFGDEALGLLSARKKELRDSQRLKALYNQNE